MHTAVKIHPAGGVQANRPVTVTGSGFRPGEKVSVQLATPRSAIRKVTADSSGRISVAVTVPNRTPAGTYALTATGTISSAPATATVTVLAAATGRALPATLVLSSGTGARTECVTPGGSPRQDIARRFGRETGGGWFGLIFESAAVSFATRFSWISSPASYPSGDEYRIPAADRRLADAKSAGAAAVTPKRCPPIRPG